MYYRSGSVAKEVLVIVLTFLAIVSGAFFVLARKDHARTVEQLLLNTPVSTKQAGESSSQNSPVQNSNTALPPTSSGGKTQDIIVQAPLVQNENKNTVTTKENVPVVQNINVNTARVQNPTSSEELKGNSSIQAFAQKKIGVEYLVVKTAYTENKIFETLTPFVSKVKVERYLLQKGGATIGYLYEIKKVDPLITNTYIFLKDLAENILKSSKVSISSAPIGKRSFYYNNVDKPELLRIVVESRSGMVLALDIPSIYEQDFKEFLRLL